MCAKYYVHSGELDRVLEAKSPREACEKAINKTNGETLGNVLYVDERGFRGLGSLGGLPATWEINLNDIISDCQTQ